MGIVPVPDARLDALAKIDNPAKIVPATVEFVDIAGLVAGASQGEGLGNQFLANIRETDAIAEGVHVALEREFPALKHFDAITGGVLGFARGYFFVFLLFTLVPILLTALPVQAISDYINASKFGSHFLETNFVTSIIKGAM